MREETTPGTLSLEDCLSRAEGRKARRHSATAKLTREEHLRIAKAARVEGKALSEWCRDVMLAAVRGDAVTPVFTEIIAMRALLNSMLRLLVTGEQLSSEKFSEELQALRTKKHDAAAEVMRQYALKGETR